MKTRDIDNKIKRIMSDKKLDIDLLRKIAECRWKNECIKDKGLKPYPYEYMLGFMESFIRQWLIRHDMLK